MPVDRQGILPFYRYVVREKGKVAVTFDSCASCHTRVLPDGTVVKGAQGSIAFGKSYAYWIEQTPRHKLSDGARNELLQGYGAPWILPDPLEPLASATLRDLAKHLKTIPSGVNPRQGTSVMFPTQIPDLIGLKDRLYFDHTGLQQHRSIVDLMRYDAINNFIEEITSYGGFIPSTMTGNLPDPAKLSRASDMELYALALYLYSLSPPPNPNQPNSLTRRGALVFQREGCDSCHTPPLYTNNMLTPVNGFRIPADDRQKYRILDVVVGTDPVLATKTRRGTGYYKVPSLKGVWYRGPFEHNGSVATLEDWFDPRRLRDDYIPTGYRGYGNASRAIRDMNSA
jgi:RoxA-like, cytochrome c-like